MGMEALGEGGAFRAVHVTFPEGGGISGSRRLGVRGNRIGGERF